MNAEEKLQIIEKGKKVGVTRTCKEHDISRTLYYRWLSRYNTNGMIGLENSSKNAHTFRSKQIDLEAVVLYAISKHPEYGPQRISWSLTEEGIMVSTSGVYNILKKHRLNTKKSRMQFSSKNMNKHQPLQLPSHVPVLPPYEELACGDYWLLWIDDLGYKDQLGNLHLYVALDVKSGFVCARIHTHKKIFFQRELLTLEVMPLCEEMLIQIKWVMSKKDDDLKTTLKELHLFQRALKKEKIEHLLWQDQDPYISHKVAQFKKKMVAFWMDALSKKHTMGTLKEAFGEFVKGYNMDSPGSHAPTTPYEMMIENKKMPISLLKWAQKSSLY